VNEKRERILLKACLNKGQISFNTVRDIYSNKQSAKNAVEALVEDGFLKNNKLAGQTSLGKFEVVKIPRSVKKEYKSVVDE